MVLLNVRRTSGAMYNPFNNTISGSNIKTVPTKQNPTSVCQVYMQTRAKHPCLIEEHRKRKWDFYTGYLFVLAEFQTHMSNISLQK